MKPRSTLNASEVMTLLDYLQRRLDATFIASQPEVGLRILNLVMDPDAGLRNFADAVKADAALTGRLLRMANAAFFAQRQPVTNIERACVLLGLERLKAVSCGFCLCRAASVGAPSGLSRRVWGESLLRACLMSELAKSATPGLAPEAFIVGLMLDAGLPLLVRWIGPAAEQVLASENDPVSQFRAEFATLPYTHVDIVASMAKRWRFPELLARPIERHHSEPGSRARADPVHQLHRLAYWVGALRLDAVESESPRVEAPGETMLEVGSEALAEAVQRATREFAAMQEAFRDLAAFAGSVEAVAERAHQQLVVLMDETMVSQLRRDSQSAPACFSIGGHRVEVETVEGGQAVAYLNDTRGRRLLSHAFRPGEQDAKAILEALGVEHAPGDQDGDLELYLRSLAA